MLVAVVILLVVLACVIARLVPVPIRLPIWVLVIVACVVPWSGWVGHTHWARVVWVPFFSGPLLPIDVLVNVVLYVPFGIFHAGRAGRAGAVARCLGWAVLLSFVTEASQVFSHGRFPSMTDVLTNTAGAWMGAAAAARLGWGASRRAGNPA